MSYTVEDIAKLVNGEVVGDQSKVILGVSKIEDASASDLCFISNKKYLHFLQTSNAGAIIVGADLEDIPEGKTVIKCAMPYVAFCQALIECFDYKPERKGIHPSAVIESSAQLGNNVFIGPNVYIGEEVSIGDNCQILANTSIYENSSIGAGTVVHANVSIYYDSHIGEGCIIHSGTVIGSDGFGHAPLPDGTYVKIPQIGNVIIGSNVELGSNCSVDRANMGSTVIHDGCRIDNLIHIAHGVEIGKHTVIAAQTGISGSTTVGEHCIIAGQVGVVGHISIADKVQIGAQSGVSNSIKEVGGKFTDSPHLPLAQAMRSRILYKKLPDMEQRLRAIEQQQKDTE